LVALGIAITINYLLAGIVISLDHGYRFAKAISIMRIGSWSDFALALVSWSVLGAMVAVLYNQIHPLALFAFLAPTLLSRQALKKSQMLIDTRQAYRSSEEALRQISQHVYDERFDERKLIAADLHDEVLQPLFKVTLMAHVLKVDLSRGRLLEIEEDLPQLVTAAELASTTLRDLIGNLRRSSIGLGGLPQALRRLLQTLSAGSGLAFHSDIDSIQLQTPAELALYQIAKEALANSLNHSKGSNVWVELKDESGAVRMSIRDDGQGFDVTSERDGHYGLAIMRERAAAAGGQIYIDPIRGGGTSIVAVFPKVPKQESRVAR
jgi:signal transduction histidine kinase